MTKQTSGRWSGPVTIIVAVVVAAGCATQPGAITTGEPSIGYWMAASAGNGKDQEVNAARIAAAEFPRRATGIPVTLHELRAYRARLLAPIEVPALFPAGSPGLRGISQAEITKMADYAAAHKEAGTIAGAQYCRQWADELAKIAPVMKSLEERVDLIVRGAAEKLRQGNVVEAEAAWQEAKRTDRDGARLLGLEREILIAKNRGALEMFPAVIATNFLKRAGELQKKFGSPDSSEAVVAGCLAITGDAEKAIIGIRESWKTADGQKFATQEVEKALLGPEKDVAAVRGKCWAEQVRLLAAGKKFWQAHQYADERIREAATMAEHRKTAAVGPLAESYRQMLLPAVRELVNQANSQLERDAYGIALTICRMAEAMVQFARDCQLRIPDDVTTWERRCEESRSDAQKKIAAAVQRRLLVGDFSPLTRENQRLSARVLDRCVELLSESTTNTMRAARCVIVEKLGDAPRKGDYVIECSVPESTIIDAPPVESERPVVKVGRDIHEIPNPQYGPENRGVPKTVFSQEVYCYQSTRRRCAKKVRLQVSLTCTHDNQKKNLLSLNIDFGEGKTTLEGVRMSGLEEQLDPPFLGTPRIAAARRSLPVDPWPKAVPAMLSSDAEIAEAVQKYAADRIVDAIVASESSYPVGVLAAEAVRQAKLGRKSEAANSWGLCLEYCSQLYGGKEDSAWTLQRDRMLSRISDLCGTAWKNCDGEVLKKMSDLWSEAVRSAQEAVAQNP